MLRAAYTAAAAARAHAVRWLSFIAWRLPDREAFGWWQVPLWLDRGGLLWPRRLVATALVAAGFGLALGAYNGGQIGLSSGFTLGIGAGWLSGKLGSRLDDRLITLAPGPAAARHDLARGLDRRAPGFGRGDSGLWGAALVHRRLRDSDPFPVRRIPLMRQVRPIRGCGAGPWIADALAAGVACVTVLAWFVSRRCLARKAAAALLFPLAVWLSVRAWRGMSGSERVPVPSGSRHHRVAAARRVADRAAGLPGEHAEDAACRGRRAEGRGRPGRRAAGRALVGLGLPATRRWPRRSASRPSAGPA